MAGSARPRIEGHAHIASSVARGRGALADELSPDGFNIGLNEGAAAGQTMSHTHIHIIPRFEGDVLEPRGGLRWVITGKAPYWE